MGLDMYLYAKKYYSGSEYSTPEQQADYKGVMSLANISEFADDSFPSAHIAVKVAYWRKQNAVHQWFVTNVQGGQDECQEFYVDREKLAELRSLCRQVLADKSLANELLPTSDGFFFGGTDYDDYYLNGLTYTADTIDKLLTMPDEWDLYYHSSW